MRLQALTSRFLLRLFPLAVSQTNYIPKLSSRIKQIFKAADLNADGRLNYAEVIHLCSSLSERYPVMSAQMSMITNQLSAEKDLHREIPMDEFRKMLETADKQVRTYPATAQVASQQGKYLARRFNAFARHQMRIGAMHDVGGRDHVGLEQKVVRPGAYPRLEHPPISIDPLDPNDAARKPFRYRHLGSLAYIGGETAAIDLGGQGTFTGTAAFWSATARATTMRCSVPTNSESSLTHRRASLLLFLTRLWKSAYLNESDKMKCNRR